MPRAEGFGIEERQYNENHEAKEVGINVDQIGRRQRRAPRSRRAAISAHEGLKMLLSARGCLIHATRLFV
jgi:hypothetical protein